MTLIGLTGYAGSGKSEAARILSEIGCERRKFAAPLKAMIGALLGAQGASAEVIERMLEGDLKEVPSAMLGGQTPRHAMQSLGTEWGRMRMCDTLWVDAALRTLDGPAVFDDVRFANEADAIRAQGGVIVQINRPGVGPVNGHVSEYLLPAEFTIPNDGGLDDLRARMLAVVGVFDAMAEAG